VQQFNNSIDFCAYSNFPEVTNTTPGKITLGYIELFCQALSELPGSYF
jgi:hypothetical protein